VLWGEEGALIASILRWGKGHGERRKKLVAAIGDLGMIRAFSLYESLKQKEGGEEEWRVEGLRDGIKYSGEKVVGGGSGTTLKKGTNQELSLKKRGGDNLLQLLWREEDTGRQEGLTWEIGRVASIHM